MPSASLEPMRLGGVTIEQLREARASSGAPFFDWD